MAGASDPWGRRAVAAALIAYALGLLLWWPAALTNSDEALYVRQAVAFAHGSRTVLSRSIDGDRRIVPSIYPPGTSALMTPLVAVGGWRAAYVLPAVSLAAAALALAWCLERAGRSPRFALLALGFPPALVLGRVAMSDVPALAITALALALLLRGLEPSAPDAPRAPRARWPWLLGAGALIGASCVVRDPAPIVLMPLVLGALARRDPGSWALVAGGLAGGSLRLLGQWLVFDDPLLVRDSFYGFSLGGLLGSADLLAVTLLVLVPGGLVAAATYRGPRRPELLCGVLLIVALLSYDYSARESGGLKRLVLGGRYVLPAVPLLVHMAGEAFPRLWGDLLGRAGARRDALERAGRVVVTLWTIGVIVACFAVHPVLGSWAEAQARLPAAIHEATPEGAVVITSWDATSKYLHELHGARVPVDRRSFGPLDRLDEGLARRAFERGRGQVFVVFVEREDSARWRQNAAENAAFVEAFGARWALEPVLDERPTAADRVRVWRVRGPP